MRRILLVLNAAVAVVSLMFFLFTFVGHAHIQQLAREFVVLKTREHSEPAVKAVELALASELSKRYLDEGQRAVVRAEIAEFHSRPTDYIQRIASSDTPIKPKIGPHPWTEKISLWKERIRVYYNSVIARLFTDLRIFAGTNIVAACLAFGFAWRSPVEPTWRLKLISGVLLAAVVFGSWMYVDSLSFFTILFNNYIGWSYPGLLVALFYQILIRIDEFTQAAKAPEPDKSLPPGKVPV